MKLQNFVLAALHEVAGQREAEHDLVFHKGGQPLRQRKIKVEFRRLLSAAGIRSIRLYDLRHTAATLAVAAGVSVKVISDQLGHASISFTLERYLLEQIRGEHRVTVGADKGYDTRDFVAECRNLQVTPHVAQNTKRRGGSAIDERTTRPAGYGISQKKRKRIEESFGWLKTIALESPLGSQYSQYGKCFSGAHDRLIDGCR